MAHQRAPAAANIQIFVALFDLEAISNQAHLVVLSFLERGAFDLLARGLANGLRPFRLLVVHTRGVYHAWPEESTEKVVAAVIVVSHLREVLDLATMSLKLRKAAAAAAAPG